MTDEETLLQALSRHLTERPEQQVFTFLDGEGAEVDALSVRALVQRSAALAERLRRAGVAPGDRALLVYPPDGLDAVVALFACLMIRAIAVPVTSPDLRHPERALPALRHIAADCGARFALTRAAWRNQARLHGVRDRLSALLGAGAGPAAWPEVRWLTASTARRVSPEAARAALHRAAEEAAPETPALLQYTSGATADPKGVALHHREIRHNLALLARNLRLDADAVVVGWAPLGHGMGLIGGALSVAWAGARLVLFSPRSFRRSPTLWLEALTRYRATHTASPNAGYETLLRALEDPGRYDLSSLKGMVQGGEPMRAETADHLAEALAAARLDPGALTNVYGLAETVLFASGQVGRGPRRLLVSRGILERERRVDPSTGPAAMAVMSCGVPDAAYGVDLQIVDDDGRALPEGRVGEVWLRSPSNAPGTDAGPDSPGYLRTGDLGFLHAGELYLCGRKADVMVLAGRTVHPEDVEPGLQDAHPALRLGCVGVFSAPVDGDEALVVFAEVEQARADAPDLGAVLDAVHAEVRVRSRLPCGAVVLLPPGGLPRTTSGKVRRAACRRLWRDGQLGGSLAVRRYPTGAETEARDWRAAPEGQRRGAIREATHALIAQVVGEGDPVPPDVSLGEPGVDALTALHLREAIAASLGVSLPSTFLIEHPTARGVAEAVANRLRTEVNPASARLVLQLSRGTEGPSIFFIHPAAGGVELYLPLARALEGVATVRAIRAPGVEPGETPLERLDDLIERYLPEILSAQPAGPFALCGYAAGGVLAWELANELRVQGHTVASLVLLDPLPAEEARPCRGVGADVLRFCQGLLEELGAQADFGVADASLCAEAEAWEAVGRWLAQHRFPMNAADLRRRFDVRVAFGEALRGHQPQRFHGRVVLVRSDDDGWEPRADTLTRHPLPGRRVDLLQRNEAQVVELLKAELRALPGA
ncbi:MAG: AMP-binding protein [Alphaproteobacteria bacterium]|nr:AMP-binding protein [Alphaproteobacteria bacterium]MCB9791128.1 AMP-binding protein [Alphaproteobacteria bacterium]